MADGRFNFLVEATFIGDKGVGKSSLFLQERNNTFTSSFITTAGLYQSRKTHAIDDFQIKLQLWDKFEDYRDSRNSPSIQLVFLVYDVTDEQSFQNLHNYRSKLNQIVRRGEFNLVLIANKVDLLGQKTVNTARGQALARRIAEDLGVEVPFFEASAKTGENVQTAFERGIRDVCRRFNVLRTPQPPVVQVPPPQLPAAPSSNGLRNFFRAVGRGCLTVGRGCSIVGKGLFSVIRWPFRKIAQCFSSGREEREHPSIAGSGTLGIGRAVGGVNRTPADNEPPDEFNCSITHELMQDPVVISTGHTYERSAIAQWFQSHDTCPKTNRHCGDKTLTSNVALKQAIGTWKSAHPGYSSPATEEEKHAGSNVPRQEEPLSDAPGQQRRYTTTRL